MVVVEFIVSVASLSVVEPWSTLIASFAWKYGMYMLRMSHSWMVGGSLLRYVLCRLPEEEGTCVCEAAIFVELDMTIDHSCLVILG